MLAGPLPQGGLKVTPGWTEYVKSYQDKSLFRNGVWHAAGCPEVKLYEINSQAKMQFKYAVHRLKQAVYNIKKDNLLTGLLDGGMDVFKEVKKW